MSDKVSNIFKVPGKPISIPEVDRTIVPEVLMHQNKKKKEWMFSHNLDVHVHTPHSDCCTDITLDKLQKKAG